MSISKMVPGEKENLRDEVRDISGGPRQEFKSGMKI
jgi:hypothetical protein